MNAVEPEADARFREARTRAMVRYLLALAAGGLLALGLLAATVGFLALRGTLPPPQIANSLCLDEKLAFMRAAPPRDPKLLVVGSSVAWRHFNSPVAVQSNPTLRPFNAGLCGTNIAQTKAVTGWLLKRVPSVGRVLLIASPVDFADCSASAPSTFDVSVADRYIFGREPLYRFYLSYFDPGTLLGNAVGLRQKRTDMSSFDSLVINRYGDGPLEPPHARDLLYGSSTFDGACFGALRGTAVQLKRQGIPFDVALTPLHPAWQRQFDPNGQVTGNWQRRISAVLGGTGARLLVPSRYPEGAFFDAIHLRWSHTPQFTRSVIMRPSSASLLSSGPRGPNKAH